MNFAESTQRLNWIFTADQLARLRHENRQRSLDALIEAQRQAAASQGSLEPESTTTGAAPAAAEPLSLHEEGELLKYYGSRLQHVCRELRLPRRVLGSALTYLKRIYLAVSCLEQDPQQLLLTCLYLACKIEEHYISAAELGRLTGAPAEVILRTELTALQALKFDLIVYSPYKSIDGFLEDIKEAAAEAEAAGGAAGAAAGTAAGASVSGGLDPGMAGLSEEQLAKVRQAAYNAADSLMLSDAPLLHMPGQLALAALRSAFNKIGIKLQRYPERVAQRGSGGSGNWRQQLQQLQAALAALDLLGAEAVLAVEQAKMVALDRRLKTCRALLQQGSGKSGSKGKAQADKHARKAAKAAEKRDADEAALGIQSIEQPAAKRLRIST